MHNLLDESNILLAIVSHILRYSVPLTLCHHGNHLMWWLLSLDIYFAHIIHLIKFQITGYHKYINS